MSNYFRNYSLPPTQPFRQPISSHPPAAPCQPGARLAEGSFVSRGGLFEGPAMTTGQFHCGYWSDHVGDVNLWQQAYPPHRPGPTYGLRTVKQRPSMAPMGFQPLSTMLGFPPRTYRRAMQGFGAPPTASVPAVSALPGYRPPPPSMQRQTTYANIVNRSRHIWTGPLHTRAAPPAGWTPRGGVLDGNTLGRGQDQTAAFYESQSPGIMQPTQEVTVLPNPVRQAPVRPVGWGIPGSPPMMKQPFSPAAQRARLGAQEATKATAIAPGGPRGADACLCPRALGAGPDGLGATMIERAGQSIRRGGQRVRRALMWNPAGARGDWGPTPRG